MNHGAHLCAPQRKRNAAQLGRGVQGTWTPLHADVLRSYSWSTNVAGRKRWLLLPPCHTHLLYDRFGQHMAPDFSPETVAGAPSAPKCLCM